MTAEEYELLIGAKFRLERNWSWAQINREFNLLNTPLSTQKNRINRYIERGEIIIKQ